MTAALRVYNFATRVKVRGLMRVLYITDFLPHSRVDHGGGKLLFRYAQEIRARGHSVSLLALCQPKDAGAIESARAAFDTSEIIVVPNTWSRRMRSFLGSLFRTEARSYCLSAGLHLRARAFLARHDFDVIHAFHPPLIRIAADALTEERRPQTRLIGHVNDVNAVVLRRRMRRQPSARLLKDLVWTTLTEFTDYALADGLFVHTQSDLDVISKHIHRPLPIRVIPIWFDAMDRLACSADTRALSQVFIVVGTSSDPRMRMGVDWLVANVWPAILKRFPGASLNLFSVRPEHLHVWADEPGVVPNRYVDDLIPEYDRARALLFPLQNGGYSRHLKVLNAMARACPIIMTTEANTSEQLRDGAEALIRDDALGFIEGISALLTDPGMGQRIAQAALNRIAGDYRGLDMIKELLAVYSGDPADGPTHNTV